MSTDEQTLLENPQPTFPSTATAIANDKPNSNQDCLSCRLTGAFTFIALGAYTYHTGTTQLRLQRNDILKSGSRFGLKSRHSGILGVSGVLVGMGLWRLVN